MTGDQESIRRLTEAIGFKYVYQEKSDEYAHGSTLVILSPKGKISSYFHGINYLVRDLRLALVEASQGRIGSLKDQFLLFCYHYDPATGKYGFAIMSILRIAGLITIIALALLIYFGTRHPKSNRKPSMV